METHRIIHNRFVLSAFIVLILSTLSIASSPALLAQEKQTTASPTRREQQGNTPKPDAIPADHYDPDDVKTYPDVVTEDRDVTIRGQQFTVHFYRPANADAPLPAIYACGDGGWRGLAPRTAQQLAHSGFAVAGIDSKVYLRELSSTLEPLTFRTIAADYAEVAKTLRAYAGVEASTPVYVFGWSLGAGFAVAVGSDRNTRSNWAGIVAIGLPAQNQLVSGLGANHADLGKGNQRYGFRTESILAAVAPIPLVMIESTSDTASPQKVGKALFAVAREPKQYVLIKADNHRFSGARTQFYTALTSASGWIRRIRGNENRQQVTSVKDGGQG